MATKNFLVQEGIDSSTYNDNFLPMPGTIMPYLGATAPTGWLLCNGGSFSASDYPLLYAALGNSTTLPDFRDRFLVGETGAGGVNTFGSANHTHSVTLTDSVVADAPAASVAHTHTVNTPGNTGANNASQDHIHSYGATTNFAGGTTFTVRRNEAPNALGVVATGHFHNAAGYTVYGNWSGAFNHGHGVTGANSGNANTAAHKHVAPATNISPGTINTTSNTGTTMVKYFSVNFIIKAG